MVINFMDERCTNVHLSGYSGGYGGASYGGSEYANPPYQGT